MDQMLSVLLRVVCVPLSSLFFCKTEQINALVSPFSPHCLYGKHFLNAHTGGKKRIKSTCLTGLFTSSGILNEIK